MAGWLSRSYLPAHGGVNKQELGPYRPTRARETEPPYVIAKTLLSYGTRQIPAFLLCTSYSCWFPAKLQHCVYLLVQVAVRTYSLKLPFSASTCMCVFCRHEREKPLNSALKDPFWRQRNEPLAKIGCVMCYDITRLTLQPYCV